jgi:NAD(P)H-dependent FMN reductase
MEKLKLALVYGSVREGRLCDEVAEWAAAQVQADATFEISVVDPRSI